MPRYTLTLRNLDLPDCLEVVQALSDIGASIDLEWTAEEVTP
jgi:hypothetical protein